MLADPLLLLIFVILLAVAFDFVNGFHDASNSIATIVASGVLSPRKAVLWAASFNFLAILVFDTGVAKTVGNNIIKLETITQTVIIAGLAGATLWGLITWWFKWPTSSSHALIGGYAGAAICHYGMQAGWNNATHVIIWDGWIKTVAFIIIAPILGLVLGALLMRIILHLIIRYRVPPSDKKFTWLQLASSAFLSLSHGGNDAQKTAGIIAGALVASGYSSEFHIPLWVLFLSYGVMAMGTFFGGWRIVETLGHKITRLRPASGFCAESAAATAIITATFFKLPISTTQATTGAIIGTGIVRRANAVQWNVATNIFLTWICTIPAAAMLGGILIMLLESV